MWKHFTRFFEVFSHIAIITAVGIAWFEYRGQVERAAKEHSLIFVSRFQDSHFTDARRLMLKPWLKYDLERLSKSNASTEMIDELVFRIVEQNASDDPKNDMLNSIVALVEFLDSVHICVTSKVCDGDVVDELLGGFSLDFYCLYQPVINGTRATASFRHFGAGAKALAERKGKC